MDLLAELRRKTSEMGSHQRVDGIKPAIRHIEVAERYLNRGRFEQDPDSYNDVVYRTNQAFEGMLKEAYAVIEDTNATRLSPNEIEQYFVTKKRLTERVWALFKNYRQQWRNPATHDHTLLFSEQEAILAIVNVSAFSVVLLDQIVETVSFKRQRAETARSRDALIADVSNSEAKPLAERAVAMLLSFIRHIASSSEEIRSEAELIGRMSGFLVGLQVDLEVIPEARLAHQYRADLLLRQGADVVVVEVKHGRADRHFLEAAIAQLRESLRTADVNTGILCLWSKHRPFQEEVSRLHLDDGMRTIWIIGARSDDVRSAYPESFLRSKF